VSYDVDGGEIAVTAEPSNKTIQKEAAGDLVLTVPAGYTVTGWYIDGALAGALGTDLTVSLDPANYSARTHSVTVFATKGVVPYSWRDTFTVEAAAGGGDSGGEPLGPLNLDDFIAATVSMGTNTPEAPVTLKLDAAVDITTSATDLYNALKASEMTDKYIVVDLSEHEWTETTKKFNQAFSVASVVGVILPPGLTKFSNGFLNKKSDRDEYSGLRSVIIPPLVATINNNAFGDCPNLALVIFEGSLVSSLAGNR
jgi:hypothetical protein